jgi:hypothetical protein
MLCEGVSEGAIEGTGNDGAIDGAGIDGAMLATGDTIEGGIDGVGIAYGPVAGW